MMANEMIRMTWPEFAAAGDCVVALCVGSVEQHGPHLPFSTDLLIPYDLCLDLSDRCNLLVAPPVYYGYRSQPATGGGMSFPGTTAVSAATLMKLVEEILADFYRQGKKKFLVMSGHYENSAFLSESAYLFTSAHPDAKVMLVNWFEMVRQETLDRLFDGKFPGWEVEHASLTETALLMHYHPELVREDRIPLQEGKPFTPRPAVYPEPAGLVPPSGILYTANGATAEIGRAMAQEIVEAIAGEISREFAPA